MTVSCEALITQSHAMVDLVEQQSSLLGVHKLLIMLIDTLVEYMFNCVGWY